MKNCIKQLGLVVLLILSAMVFISCDEWESDSGGITLPANLVTSSGGVIKAFDGNVTISIPEGALKVPEEFRINVCLDQYECDFLLRPVSIEPVMLFEKPVTVTLKYDGELAVSPIEIPENTLLMATIWETEMDFFNNQSCGNCLCCVDNVIHTITFCICNSGIMTIEPPNQ